MSEAAPGLPDSPAFATPERAALAAALRGLIDAAMSVPDLDVDTLGTAAAEIEAIAARFGRGPEGAGYRPRSHGDYLPRSPIVGEASPLSPRLDWEVAEIDGRPGIEARGAFGAAYEGPPGYVHGGWLACAFDEVLGIANIVAGHPGMTGRLTIHYRRPTPLFADLRFAAGLDRIEGRRIISRARCFHGDLLTCEAEGVFVQPDPERARQYFGEPSDPA